MPILAKQFAVYLMHRLSDAHSRFLICRRVRLSRPPARMTIMTPAANCTVDCCGDDIGHIAASIIVKRQLANAHALLDCARRLAAGRLRPAFDQRSNSSNEHRRQKANGVGLCWYNLAHELVRPINNQRHASPARQHHSHDYFDAWCWHHSPTYCAGISRRLMPMISQLISTSIFSYKHWRRALQINEPIVDRRCSHKSAP